jgi:hypothetical protein
LALEAKKTGTQILLAAQVYLAKDISDQKLFVLEGLYYEGEIDDWSILRYF